MWKWFLENRCSLGILAAFIGDLKYPSYCLEKKVIKIESVFTTAIMEDLLVFRICREMKHTRVMDWKAFLSSNIALQHFQLIHLVSITHYRRLYPPQKKYFEMKDTVKAYNKHTHYIIYNVAVLYFKLSTENKINKLLYIKHLERINITVITCLQHLNM